MAITQTIRRLFLYPLWVKKNRSQQLKYLRKYEKMQWWDKIDLENMQLNYLKKLTTHAYHNSPFYMERFQKENFKPEDLKTLSDIKNFPVLTKDEIQEYGDQLIARGYTKESMIQYKTGGSTGKSLTVYGDLGRLDRNTAAALVCYRWTGWNIGDPMGRIWGNPPVNKTIKDKVKELIIGPNIWLDTIDLNEKSMIKFIEQWQRLRPVLLHGHSHSLYEFAKFLKQSNYQIVKPKGIISTSMMLPSN